MLRRGYMMKETVLLATFLNNRRSVSSVLKIIAEHFEVINDRIFLLRDVEDTEKFILSYSIVKEDDMVFSEVIRNTISLHRKKETNTLYTLNALNELVMEQNQGKLDPSFPVNWDDYNNSILLTRVDSETNNEEFIELRQINTKLEKVFKLRREFK
jgi:hypothetical protein